MFNIAAFEAEVTAFFGLTTAVHFIDDEGFDFYRLSYWTNDALTGRMVQTSVMADPEDIMHLMEIVNGHRSNDLDPSSLYHDLIERADAVKYGW